MKGKLYLAGGGSEKQSFTPDKEIFKNVKNILYIPFAWDEDETYESCRKWFCQMLSLHHKISYYMMKDLYENLDFNKYDLVYISGGNTFKLLKELRESNLDKKLITYLNNGGNIYGGSAGAIIWGKTIETVLLGKYPDKNKVQLTNLTGFNLINYDIFCHYTETSDKKSAQEYSKLAKRKLIAIPEECVVEITNGKINRMFGTEKVELF